MKSVFLITTTHHSAMWSKGDAQIDTRVLTARALERWENEGGKVPEGSRGERKYQHEEQRET